MAASSRTTCQLKTLLTYVASSAKAAGALISLKSCARTSFGFSVSVGGSAAFSLTDR